MKPLFWLACAAAALEIFADAASQTAAPAAATDLPLPTADQAAWEDAELGMFVHFDIEVFDKNYQYSHPRGSSRPPMGAISPAEFNPSSLDTDQWMQVAQALGARYVVFTAKHSSGFLMWQSDLYPYGVRQSPWQDGRGDVVQDFLASCKKYGLQPGLYCSAGGNSYWNLHNGPVQYRGGRLTGRPEDMGKFLDLDLRMYTELFQKAGPLFYVWLDGGVKPFGDRLRPIFEKYEPHAVVFNGPASGVPGGLARWSGNEKGFVAYPFWNTIDFTDDQSDRGPGSPEGKLWIPVETNVPLRYHVWMWQADDENKILSLSSLMTMYLDSVGRGCNFIINANIGPDGRVPEADARRLAEFGAKIREWFGRSLAETDGNGDVLELKLPQPQDINCVSVMEDIRQGQRIRRYAIDGLVDGKWRELGTGESVGHKRIQVFDRVKVAAVRLRITQSAAEPVIRRLAVYNIDVLPPDPNDPATQAQAARP